MGADLSTRIFLRLTAGRASSFGLPALPTPLACTRGRRREIWEDSRGSALPLMYSDSFKPPVATGDGGTAARGTLTYISAHPEQNPV